MFTFLSPTTRNIFFRLDSALLLPEDYHRGDDASSENSAVIAAATDATAAAADSDAITTGKRRRNANKSAIEEKKPKRVKKTAIAKSPSAKRHKLVAEDSEVIVRDLMSLSSQEKSITQITKTIAKTPASDVENLPKTALCHHVKNKLTCEICNRKSLCVHSRMVSDCPDCNAPNATPKCIHNKEKAQCRSCRVGVTYWYVCMHVCIHVCKQSF